MNKPRYADRIIVGVKSCIGFSWHISGRDNWIMDIYKYQNAYQKYGYKVNMDFILSFRNNMAVFNESNYIQYLSSTDDEVVSTEELKSAIKCFDKSDTILAYQPSIYVDFIERQLFSMYPENLPFEKYVPDGWKGEITNFLEHIPQSEQYWNENGTNLIDVIFERETREFKEGENYGM